MTDLKVDQGDRRTTVTDKRKTHVGSKESSLQISSRIKNSRKEVIGYKRSIHASRSGGPERKRGKGPTLQRTDAGPRGISPVQRKKISGIQTLQKRSKIQAAVYTLEPSGAGAGTGAEKRTVRVEEEAEDPNSNCARKWEENQQQKDGVAGSSRRRRQQQEEILTRLYRFIIFFNSGELL
ncbi:hypothetical protein TNCV_3106871 [Trichonephila clavipes]|nr:hypothetical protein TNCV_3106871 [Trichonephila clavipes]